MPKQPLFQKRHYCAIAKVLQQGTWDEFGCKLPTDSLLVGRFLSLFEDDNPKFDKAKFVRAVYKLS